MTQSSSLSKSSPGFLRRSRVIRQRPLPPREEPPREGPPPLTTDDGRAALADLVVGDDLNVSRVVCAGLDAFAGRGAFVGRVAFAGFGAPDGFAGAGLTFDGLSGADL